MAEASLTLKPGWYWARHRYWDFCRGKWLLIYVENAPHGATYRGQTAHLHEKERCTRDIWADDFEGFTAISFPA